jgi:hypothetical protein
MKYSLKKQYIFRETKLWVIHLLCYERANTKLKIVVFSHVNCIRPFQGDVNWLTAMVIVLKF